MLTSGHVPSNVYQGFGKFLDALTLEEYSEALERYQAFDRTRYHSGKLTEIPTFEIDEPLPATGIMAESVFDPHPLLQDRLDELRDLQRRHPYRQMTRLPERAYRPDPGLETQLTDHLLSDLYHETGLPRPAAPRTPLSVAYGDFQMRLARRARQLCGDEQCTPLEALHRLLDPARHDRIARQAGRFKATETCWAENAAQRTIVRALLVAQLGTHLVREHGHRRHKEEGVAVRVIGPRGAVDLETCAESLLKEPGAVGPLLDAVLA